MKQPPGLFITITIAVGIFSSVLIFWQWQTTIALELSNIGALAYRSHHDPAVLLQTKKKRLRPQTVKGVYLTARTAGSPEKLAEIISLLDRTELNAVVIDIKDYSGRVLYQSEAPLVKTIGASENHLGDVPALIQKLHQHHIYVIARQTVFQDPYLATKKPEWALRSHRDGLWRDRKGLAWVDPARREVWDYNLAIAREAMRLGFDEINFDYVRFPSDGEISDIVLPADAKKYEVVADFFHYLSMELKGGAPISLDLFGFVLERTGDDDLQVGQRLLDAVDQVDYVSPMMYPSHYPPGHLGLQNPAAEPAMVLDYGLTKGALVFVGRRARLRPWLQAFNLGAVYDGAKIRTEIDTVEKYTDAGWLLWNARNVYTEAGLWLEPGI